MVHHDYVNVNTSEPSGPSETWAYVFWAGTAIVSTGLVVINMIWVMGAL
jgi:hypothetical protein